GWSLTNAVGMGYGQRLDVDNCLLTARIATGCKPGAPTCSVRLTRDTFATALTLRSGSSFNAKDLADQLSDKALRVEIADNVIDTGNVFEFVQWANEPLPPGEAEPYVPRLVSWNGERNAYGAGSAFLRLAGLPWPEPLAAKLTAGLAGWEQLWGTAEAGSVQGRIRFKGGDLLARAQEAPEKLTPEDFRLRPDSAGYQAGKDKKDLGADVDLVGPGAAYEKWKKTPEYQQ